jgi:hypothetical protein
MIVAFWLLAKSRKPRPRLQVSFLSALGALGEPATFQTAKLRFTTIMPGAFGLLGDSNPCHFRPDLLVENRGRLDSFWLN